MSASEIYNFIKVSDQILTGGQPNQEQLQAAAEEGVKAVMNLATYHPGHSLENEAEIVNSLGLRYYHIPVDWQQPMESDFDQFERILSSLGETKTLIHCAANYRVTAFYSLYALKNLGWSQPQAQSFREAIWQGSDFPVWESFIKVVERKILAEN